MPWFFVTLSPPVPHTITKNDNGEFGASNELPYMATTSLADLTFIAVAASVP